MILAAGVYFMVSLTELVAGFCDGTYITRHEHACNPALADISTAILASDGTGDYTDVCSAFDEYVLCLEPALSDCVPLRVRDYWLNKLTYSEEPYHCEAPLPTYYTLSQLSYSTGDTASYTERNTSRLNSSGCGILSDWIVVCGSVVLSAGMAILLEGSVRYSGNMS